MKVRLTRNIHHHSAETGLTSRTVYKEYEWAILPIIGATIDDSAWHRDDIPKIENINIIADEADLYYVELTSKKVDEASYVDKIVDIIKLHGWNG